MPTSNSRNISTKTREMLWGRAASRCAFPDCRCELVMERTASDNASLFGEACHMVAKEPEGPRGNSPLTSKQRDEYDNLLLLCNIHHKVVDDQFNTYSVERLMTMKAEHEQWVRASLQGRSPIWSVPYQRNGLFTGREDLLNTLHDRLTTTKSTALTQPQAISGLGGIGKTQIALEYAYSYRDSYHAVFWVRAATRETLVLDYVSIAGLLRLPEKDEQDQNIIVLAVKRWLAENTNWLLILDNADELEMVHEFLPAGSRGHIILTTRASATRGFATRLEVDKMEKKEGILFLLRCAKVLRPEELLEQATSEQQIRAEAIVNVLDGLPLALDQAGAYIEETKCNLAEYLAFYQVHRKELLRQRGTLAKDYPASVATTWSLSFQQVERDNPAAADLLRMFAFLDPDAIPEEIVVKGASHLGPLLVTVASDSFLLLAAMKRLGAFSLVQRNAEKRVLRIHRLVQAVLRDDMTQEIQKIWAERVVKSVNEAFPFVDVTTWEQCKSYISHAQECTDLIKNFDFAFPEAARLLNQTATYYKDHALYSDAEPLLQRALSIREQVLGPQHPDTASSLSNLAALYNAQGKYELAEPLLQRALSIREQVLGPQHPDTASSLSNLAALYNAQGKYELAEPLLQRALSIREQVLGPQHPDTALSLNNLAYLYNAQGKYELAESLLQRALSIYEQALGPQHPSTIIISKNYTALLSKLNKTAQTEN